MQKKLLFYKTKRNFFLNYAKILRGQTIKCKKQRIALDFFNIFCYNIYMRFRERRILHVCLCSFVIMLLGLAAIFVFFPTNFAFAKQSYVLPDDYNAFYQSFMQMQEDVGSANDGIASISAFSSEQEEVELNRLIVSSNSFVPSCGAKWEARYKEWNFFQYETHAQTEKAYDYLINLGYDVSFDTYVTVNDGEDVQAYNTATHTYNTWADEYMHYNNFISYQLGDNQLDDVYVFVLDTGINKYHELFQGRIDETLAESFVGYTPEKVKTSTNPADYDYYDDHYYEQNGMRVYGHGTHTSGTIAELTTDNVKIVPYKVLDKNGSGAVAGIITAIEKLIDLKTTNSDMKIVANMSLGVNYFDEDLSANEIIQNAARSKLTAAVRNGAKAGVAFVVSAGNESQTTSNVSPGNCDEAIVVSALRNGGYLNNGLVFDSSYSNFGSHVDFSAPGTAIMSASNLANTAYHELSGTSMAAPHVSACYALLFSLPKYKTFEQVTKSLTKNAVDLGRSGRDDYYGYGCIDLATVDKVFSQNLVEFSQQTDEQKGMTSATFSLSFNEEGAQEVEIYYSLNEYETTLNKSTWTQYLQPVEIEKTTKVHAVATYIDEEGNLGETKLASKTYYVENYDLLSNFDFGDEVETWPFGGCISIKKYNGTELKTLNLPSVYYKDEQGNQIYNELTITSIMPFAFGSGCPVEVLNLPSTVIEIQENAFNGDGNIQEINASGVTQIGEYAFRSCKNLKTISFSSEVTKIEPYTFYGCENLLTLNGNFANVGEIGSYAFSGCTNLTLVENNFLNVWDVGTYAFENCKNLNVLTLPQIGAGSNSTGKVGKLGDYAFNNAEIAELLLGPNISDFTIKYEVKIGKLYGYFAAKPQILNCDFEYYDINLKTSKPLQEYVAFVNKGEKYEADIAVIGYKVETPIKNSGSFKQEGSKENNFEWIYHYVFDGTQSVESRICFRDTVSLSCIDAFGNQIQTPFESKCQSLTINVVDESTPKHTFTYVEKDSPPGERRFSVKVNGLLVTDESLTFYEGTISKPFKYVIEVVPDVGYQINAIVLSTKPDEKRPADRPIELSHVTQDIEMTVTTSEIKDYTLTFNYFGLVDDDPESDNNRVIVNGKQIDKNDKPSNVDKGEVFQFTVKEGAGYKLVRVSVDGIDIEAQNGVFTIDEIYKNLIIDVVFERISYKVEVQKGIGGTFSNEYGNEYNSVRRGDSVTYRFSTSQGYQLDFITVNGKQIYVKGNTFTIDNVTEDLLIVVSFKKQSGGFLSGNSVLLDYFIIFVVLFVVFGILKLVVYLIRKKHPTLRKY